MVGNYEFMTSIKFETWFEEGKGVPRVFSLRVAGVRRGFPRNAIVMMLCIWPAICRRDYEIKRNNIITVIYFLAVESAYCAHAAREERQRPSGDPGSGRPRLLAWRGTRAAGTQGMRIEEQLKPHSSAHIARYILRK